MMENFWSITIADVTQSPLALGALVALLMQLLFKPIIGAIIQKLGNPAEAGAKWLWQDVVTNVTTFLLALGGAYVVKTGFAEVALHAILSTGVAILGYETVKNVYSGATEDLKWR